MNVRLLFLLFLFGGGTFAQHHQGFDKNEARDLIALYCSYTYSELYGSDEEIIPDGYTKIYTSDTKGLDNIYQVYTKDKKAVINFRGSTQKVQSWLENLYASMVPAQGIIDVSGKHLNYRFAEDTNASIHGGYALEIAYLHDDLIQQIRQLNEKEIYTIYLSGHSQGGSLAQMFRAYIELNRDGLISPQNTFKTYTFGAPKVGNWSFMKECQSRFEEGTLYNIVNPEDAVPKLPPTTDDTSFLTKDEIRRAILEGERISIGEKMGQGTVKMFEGTIRGTVRFVGTRAHDKIDRYVDDIETEQNVWDANYIRLPEMITIDAATYPKVMIDSFLLENEKWVAKQKLDSAGYFMNDELYKKEPKFYQHKPYNYYVTILRSYFPEDYERLEKKYLVENL